MTFSLISSSFPDGSAIPEKFAFAKFDADTHVSLSDNINPHLAWTGAPKGTASFAVLCLDDKVPSQPDDVNQEGKWVPKDLPRVDFYHWLVANIPASVQSIEEGAVCRGVTARGKLAGSSDLGLLGVNDYTGWFAGDVDMEGVYGGYDGPCPPWNDTIIHHYTFKVFALDVEALILPEAYQGVDLLEAIKGHVLAEASWNGTYTINPEAV